METTLIHKQRFRIFVVARKLFETIGVSLASFLLFLGLLRFLQRMMLEDSMNFVWSKRKPVSPKRQLKDYWAGQMPPAALEVVDMLLHPQGISPILTAQAISGKLILSLLLYGLPGAGKTHFARVLAELANASFLYASASQFDEIYVGKGAQRVRRLFEDARALTMHSAWESAIAHVTRKELPIKRVIIFIDELDSIGTRHSLHGINSNNHATVSQLLTCLDGLDALDGVFVVAASNNLNGIDPALRRSGRFDRVIELQLPNEMSRLELLEFFLQHKPGFELLKSRGVLRKYAVRTAGFSAADLKNFAKEASLMAVRSVLRARSHDKDETTVDAPVILEEHLEEACQSLELKIANERRSMPRPVSKRFDAELPD